MASALVGKPRFLSIRVEILPPSAVKDKTAEPLNAFRLRLDPDSNFADLANVALSRYAKEHPECSIKPVAGGIFDEKYCSVDLEDGLDIIQQGEVLKLVLAPDESNAITGNNNLTTAAPSRPSQTPAVKKIRPITPGLLQLQALTQRSSSFPSRSSGLGSSQPRSSPLDHVLPSRSQSRCVAIKTDRRPASKGKGGKQDPYELPSDTDDNRLQNAKKSKSGTVNACDRLAKSKSNHNKVTSTTIDLTAPTNMESMPRETNVIVIEDSSSSSTSPDLTDVPSTVGLSGRLAQGATKNPAHQPQSRPDKNGKRSNSHSINDHIKVVDADGDNVEETRGPESSPPYMVKNSQGYMPVFTRRELSGQRNTARRPSTSSTSTSKSVKSAGPLTLTPSRIAAATKNLHERFQREAKAREAAKQEAALQQAQIKEKQKREKAEARRNTPSAAIARIKSMTERKFGRKEPRKRIPDAFFHDPRHPDEDEEMDDAIRRQPHMPDSESAEDEREFSRSSTLQTAMPQLKAATREAYFKPINRLCPEKKTKPESQLSGGLAAAYKQRAHNAFEDLDESDAGNTKEPQINPTSFETADEITDEDIPGTPEGFRHWLKDYETNFTPHVGFCSVADGPYKGLIRSGPRKGKYLSGHGSPSNARIAEMEKTAVRREQLSNFWDSDSEVVEHDTISESDDEKLPNPVPQFMKSSVSSGSESTSVLIMRQLSQEVPPSNQELGILMSSSPSRSTSDSVRTPANHGSPRLDDGSATSTRAIVVSTPGVHIENHSSDIDLDVTPSFERALSQVETPSTRSRSTQKTTAMSPAAVENARPATLGRIVVKVPQLSPEKQAQYQKVQENQSQHGRSPLKSFKEINRIHEDTDIASQDSGAAAIEQVLNASPSWLTNVTEIASKFPDADRRTSYRLRSHAATTPCRPTTETQRKCEVDLTKNQDPTYQPSDSHSASESSADEQRENSKSVVKKRASATSAKPIRALLFSHDALSRSSQGPNPTPIKHHKVNDNQLELIQSTPIPAPSIPDLLQRIKDTSLMKRSESVPHSPEEADLLIISQLENRSSKSTMKSDTASHASVADGPHGASNQTVMKCNKRMRKDDLDSIEKEHDSHQRKKQKKHGSSDSADRPQQLDNKDKTIRANKQRDKPRKRCMASNKALPHQDGGPNKVFDQSNASRVRSRKVLDKSEEQDNSTTHQLPAEPKPIDALVNAKTLRQRKQKRNENRKQKRTDQSHPFTLPAKSKSLDHTNVQIPKPAQERPVEVISGKKDGSKKKQMKMAYIPRSAKKLPSPPITSRPSSAGSAF
ncbi:hypothetical protein PFICI_02106 [Pestalotiopsis fici W106-1]|uniref:Uncharacterized protein n=1 Tax=Pestalotiopsis fici (strain W106-1 / CGMCC3.15140) TaxID=1229662 RepID=W3XQG3_PESFW|nr:uncharacterized protein PFICI_02106 [Pestalotiopsis fici W106-1]ETS88278.1 hypothetical protein PFICI_02106 [Pestalotiopsis fici W106-1]